MIQIYSNSQNWRAVIDLKSSETKDKILIFFKNVHSGGIIGSVIFKHGFFTHFCLGQQLPLQGIEESGSASSVIKTSHSLHVTVGQRSFWHTQLAWVGQLHLFVLAAEKDKNSKIFWDCVMVQNHDYKGNIPGVIIWMGESRQLSLFRKSLPISIASRKIPDPIPQSSIMTIRLT